MAQDKDGNKKDNKKYYMLRPITQHH